MIKENTLVKTPEEAIETIKSNMPTSGYQMLQESLDMAIEALEKQVPKNPEIYTDTRNALDLHGRLCSESVDVYLCPLCGSCVGYAGESILTYCSCCGQAIIKEEFVEDTK